MKNLLIILFVFSLAACATKDQVQVLNNSGEISASEEVDQSTSEEATESNPNETTADSTQEITEVELTETIQQDDILAETDATVEKTKSLPKRIQSQVDILSKRTYKVNSAEEFFGFTYAILSLDFRLAPDGRIIYYGESQKSIQEDYEFKNKTLDVVFEEDYNDIYKSNTVDVNDIITEDSKIGVRNVYNNMPLVPHHRLVIDDLISKFKPEEQLILFIFINGSNPKTYTDKPNNIEKQIYKQVVSNYIYKNVKKIRIETRLIENIPDNEMFLVLLNYEGILPPNVYNLEGINSAQWLSQVGNLEEKRFKAAIQKQKRLERLIESVGKEVSSARGQR